MIFNYFRRPKSKNEMSQSAAPEIAFLIRPKRRVKNLPNSWDDLRRCEDIDTKKQIRRSQNSYRDTIKNFPTIKEGV